MAKLPCTEHKSENHSDGRCMSANSEAIPHNMSHSRSFTKSCRLSGVSCRSSPGAMHKCNSRASLSAGCGSVMEMTSDI